MSIIGTQGGDRMKLEKFSKNKKQKKIIIGTIVGLIVLISGITLYRTFALYEEKKEFNVLRGRVPNFNNRDIQFAALLDDKTSNEIPLRGYKFTGYECNKKSVSVEWNYELWAPIVIGLVESGTNCTLKFTEDNSFYGKVAIGDYVSYVPSKKNYKIAKDLTGHSSEQAINPSELNLWRVIRKNENGTVDIVSEYVSSVEVYFNGKIGYEKSIGVLNTIAEQYETNGITTASRHMGYNSQTETITVSDATTAPWNTSTDSTNSPNGRSREKAGGGDTGYLIDYDLVNAAIGTVSANRVGTTTSTTYWLASRRYGFDSSEWRYDIRTISNDLIGSRYIYYHNSSGWHVGLFGHSIRPIVTLSNGVTANEGTLDTKKMWIIN